MRLTMQSILHKSNLKYLATLAATIALVVILGTPISGLTDLVGGSTSGAIAANDDSYGFATSLDSLSPTALNQRLAAMQATGATWVRFDLSWNTVQPNDASSYDWETYDRIVAAINAHHLHGLAILDFTPSWARSAACANSKMCPPKDPAQFAVFAAAATKRYQSKSLRDWEIWNEPNIAFRYHPATNPASYTAILKAAYMAIKRTDPRAFVVAGGTAPSESNATNLTPADFLTALYANGAKGYFDAVAVHPYTYPDSPADNLPLSAWGQMTTMHNIMAANGDGGKKIWITEYGAPTNGPDLANNHVSEAQQAKILSDAISVFRSYSWSGPFFWYDYQDTGSSPQTSENFYGLVRADGSYKPAYAAWVSAIAENSSN
jgi:beta-xylosidase